MITIFCMYCFMNATKAYYGQVSSNDTNLSSVSFSSGTLNTEFDPGVTNYDLNLTMCENIDITAFAEDDTAQIQINGTPCQSGTPAAIQMTKSLKQIIIVVTAENGLQRQYCFNLLLTNPERVGLSNLTLDSGSLDPVFNPDITDYSVNVPWNIETLSLKPSGNPSTKTITVNNQSVESGSSFTVQLSQGKNIITITATGEDCTSRTYIITVERDTAPPPALQSLKLSAGTLSPSFSGKTTLYTASVDSITDKETITATGNSSVKTISINNKTVDSSNGYAIDLAAGINSVTIAVTSNNSETVTYVITITKNAPPKASLSNLSLSKGTISPQFSPDVTQYTANVDSDTSEITITPTDIIQSDIIKINGCVINGTQSFKMPLVVGPNTADISLVSQDGTARTYTLTITRKAASSPSLSSLTIDSGTLSPEFSARTTNYTAKVDYSVNVIKISAIANDNTQSVTINGTPSDNCQMALNVGTNHAEIIVKMTDGTSKTYKLDITRCVNAPSCLSQLTLSTGTLSPSFSSEKTDYSVKVGNDVTSIFVNAVSNDFGAKVKISGTTTGNVPLSVGSNNVTITVTSVDGSVKTYTLNIFRCYKTKFTVSSKNENGAYVSAVPDYLQLVDGSDNFDFELGGSSIIISSGTLKNFKGSGNLCVSSGITDDAKIKRASASADGSCILISGTEIEINGGSAVEGSIINAGATLTFPSKVKETLQIGTPVLYYFDESSGTLVNTGASFDIENEEVSFSAQKSGNYILGVISSTPKIDYTVSAGAKYVSSGAAKSFNVNVDRGHLSTRLEKAQLMVVTTLSTGAQNYCYIPLTNDSTALSVTVDGNAVHSDVYLISGGFDGNSIPLTYSLTQSVGA